MYVVVHLDVAPTSEELKKIKQKKNKRAKKANERTYKRASEAK